MKKNILLSVLFVAVFVITYFVLCFMIPEWRIKLEADPFIYFIESVKSMAFIKTMISLVVGAILTFITGKVTGGRQ